MFVVYYRTAIRMVPSQLSVCMGVVERQAYFAYRGVHVSRIFMFLVWNAASIRRDGRDMGA
tara:strand:- start:357 stop:539 length:183 start_codon:yes stop_codon:yes gene_type:complete